MKNFFEWVGLFASAFAMIFFDAWCNMVVYNNGVWPLLGSLQIYPPALSFGFFLMLSLVAAYLWKGKTRETIQLNTTEGWARIICLFINKMFYVGLIVMFNIIIF